MPAFDVIAFDADDTLWHSEVLYADAQTAFVKMLAAYGLDERQTLDTLHKIEVDNLPTFGYGVKGFVLSLIEAAVRLTEYQVSSREIQTLIDIGRAMIAHEVHLIDHVQVVVETLARQYPLMVITKGDIIDQERKIQRSGLGAAFRYVEIVSEKTADIYAAILKRHQIAPERFLMIGNSLRSDVLPVIALGGYGVYVPYALTWAHETSTDLPAAPERFLELEHIGELPQRLASW